MGETLSTFGSFPKDVKAYLRPTAFGRVGLDDSLSLPLAGGPITFSQLEITFRQGSNKLYRGLFPVTHLTDLLAQLSDGLAKQVKTTLDHLTAARPDLKLAGIAISMKTPLVMGILNVTPDSFSDGGNYFDATAVKSRALELFTDGADILDVGAESTRPGADLVDEDEELKRLNPVFERIPVMPGPVSIDTRKAAVMAAGLKAGAAIINDVSALEYDEKSMAAAAKADAVVLMHAQGDPKTMQDKPIYDDVLLDIYDYLEGRIQAAVAAGIPREKLIVDPGFGFGKTTTHNLEILRGLSLFHGLGCPVMIGVSRKRFLGALTGEKDSKKRVSAGLAAAVMAVGQGVQIIRTHDVPETRQAMTAYEGFAAKSG